MADHQVEFALEHNSFLFKHLSKYAHKWKSLGAALNFQPYELKNIESCLSLIPDSPHSYMQRLVEEWLEGKHPHTAPPTLASLLEALNSHAVGLGTLATELRASLPQDLQKRTARVKTFEFASLSENCVNALDQIGDISVDENISINLKVKSSSGTQKFQWESTGLVPVADMPHLGKDTPTLCLLNTDIDIDGSCYSCIIECEGMETQTTAGVTLRVHCPQLDKFKENLASIYLAQPEVPEDSWPPVSNKSFINLALVKQQNIDYSGEYARTTIRGDVDDILLHKEKVKYENIFDGLRSGSLLLIEGRPGSGKTTFVHKITRDWAASEVQGPMRLVLLVSLRVLNNWTKPVILADILRLLKVQLTPETLEKRNGKGVCFIFDGLDEFSPLEGNQSIIYEIIKKQYLPKSIVIVASRPAALVKIRQRANKIVEVIGFLRDQIFEYVENYPFSNSSKVEELKSYLSSHPNVLHMCYLPIHAAMVAFLFNVMGTVPRTETEIYKHFTRFTLMRSLSKHSEQDLRKMDTDELSGEESELFDTICELAFNQTVLNKQVLDQDEIDLSLWSKSNKDVSLGLVTVDSTAGLYGYKNIYTFLHLTYQEYLAAHHLSTLSDKDQLKLIREHKDKDHMLVVWKFYCGLVKFKGQEHKIKALFTKRSDVVLSGIQCAYESQQKIVCEHLVNETNAQIVFENKFLLTSDFTALGYLLENSSESVSLSLIKCNINDEAVDSLLKETDQKHLNITKFHLTDTPIGGTALLNVIRSCEGLKSLTLNHSIEQSDVETVLIVCRNLKEIFLSTVSNTISFDVSTNPVKISPPTVGTSTSYMEGNGDKYHMVLRLEDISDGMKVTLLKLCRHFWPSRLKVFELQLSCRSEDVIEYVTDFSTLEKLVLKDIIIDDSATLLASKLSHSVLLHHVGLSITTTEGTEGIKSLLTSLTSCSNLQVLDLTRTRLMSEGACVLASCFQYWPKLQKLNLCGCGIGEEGAEAIADNLVHCTKPIKLYISNNNVSYSTTQKILSKLQPQNRSSQAGRTTMCCTLL